MPVIAFGSNAAPEQIARKFRGRPCGDRIYVEPVSLIGWDVVYAARLTGYRAIPARLAASPGCQAEAHLTWLTPAQLECMDRTEGQMYRRRRLVPGAVVDARGDAVAGAEAYLEGGNPLVVDGQQAALAAIDATGRACPGHFTRTLHERLARAAGFAGALDDFVRRLIRDAAYAERMQALLRGGL